MTTRLFVKWAEKVFFVAMEERRTRTEYQEPALVILNGCSSHHPVEFLQACDARNIDVLVLVPHSSDQCQPLDLVTFGLLKRSFGQFTFDAVKSAPSKKVRKTMGAWCQATAPHQIVSAWMSMGLIPYRGRDGLVYLRVDRARARAVRSVRAPAES
jgi:hypothetical protein